LIERLIVAISSSNLCFPIVMRENTPMPTIQSVLSAAKEAASKRLELLLLLSILAGLITSLTYRPALEVIEKAMLAFNTQQENDGDFSGAATILKDGFWPLILGQFSIIATTAFLLPPWARAASPKGLIPGEGGFPGFIKRGLIALKYLLIATLMTTLSFVVIVPVVLLISQVLGGLGSLVILFGALLMLWLNFAWSATANLAIMQSTEASPIGFQAVWLSSRPILRPTVAAFAALWLITSLINLLVGNLITQSLPEAFAKPLSLILSGSLTFAAVAMHLGALFSLPNYKTS